MHQLHVVVYISRKSNNYNHDTNQKRHHLGSTSWNSPGVVLSLSARHSVFWKMAKCGHNPNWNTYIPTYVLPLIFVCMLCLDMYMLMSVKRVELKWATISAKRQQMSQRLVVSTCIFIPNEGRYTLVSVYLYKYTQYVARSLYLAIYDRYWLCIAICH